MELMDYKGKWSEFEVQSLAFGILRKNLYPDYFVRGEYKFPFCRVDISIWKPTEDRNKANLMCVLEVKKSETGTATAQGERYESLLNVPVIYIRGGPDAYNVLELVKPYL